MSISSQFLFFFTFEHGDGKRDTPFNPHCFIYLGRRSIYISVAVKIPHRLCSTCYISRLTIQASDQSVDLLVTKRIDTARPNI